MTLSFSQVVEKYVHYIKIHRGGDAEIPSFRMNIIELLKNSMIRINKTASNIHFNKAETDRELVFQQL
ncbi:hypothetical protein KHM19_11710 [Leptospira borgpetersenii]|nr:hypothetical protein CLV95_105129 [Leptospira borgpetersenii serovar Javanica]GIM20626.1 hypothetical protein KHM09_30770 [Leptospira borgpetersenii]GIM21988.1 hypothetical protein KHM19_11710 [Leptospira borgpetersenii]GIM25030.1 hypothetical protein KHM25_09550 [Leptospira borgpetersenii]